LEYFTDGVKFSLQSALGRVETVIDKLTIEDRPTSKEKDVLQLFQERKEMTSSDLVKDLNISRQQAHNLLKSLVEKGFLGKKGKTKASYYFISS